VVDSAAPVEAPTASSASLGASRAALDATVAGAWIVLLVPAVGARRRRRRVYRAFWPGRFSGGDRRHDRTERGGRRSRARRVLQTAVGDHLDRTQMMLVELANAETDGAGRARRRAGARRGSGRRQSRHRQSALQSGDAQIVDILEDLERVLLEIANAPANATSNDLTDLQSRITREDLLFRLRVIASEMRQRNQTIARLAIRPAANADVVDETLMARG
jgi:hypothetical protein